MSSIRAMISKTKWFSVKKEEDLTHNIIEQFYKKIIDDFS